MIKLWMTAPEFVDLSVIVSPAGTVNVVGLNWKSVIVTSMVVVGAEAPPQEASKRLIAPTHTILFNFIYHSSSYCRSSIVI